jgi:hypothetical protein
VRFPPPLRLLAACGLVAAAIVLAAPGATGATSFSECTTAQLHVSLGTFQGGVGHGGWPIVFKNRGGLCALRGYPGVDGLSSSGAVVVHAKRTRYGYLGGTRTIKTVTLAKGKTASAFLEGYNAPSPHQICHPFKYLKITPPNQIRSVNIASRDSVCYPEIHPVVVGSSGSSGG